MTKPKSTYSQLLLDPRWQRKRLEALQAADFKCKECHDADSTLHVHHGHYRKGAKPWEYPIGSLHVLCAHCHEAIEMARMEHLEAVGQLCSAELLAIVTGYARAVVAEDAPGEVDILCPDYQHQVGVSHWLRVDFEELRAMALLDGIVTVIGPRGLKTLKHKPASDG